MSVPIRIANVRPAPKTREAFVAALSVQLSDLGAEAVPLTPDGLPTERWYAEAAARIGAVLDSVAGQRADVAIGVNFDGAGGAVTVSFRDPVTKDPITNSAELFRRCGGR